MKVKVFHRVDPFGANLAQVHVANVDCIAVGALSALEEAFRLTQNMNGSWSKGPLHDGYGSKNDDYNPRIERVVPLEVHDGKTFGLRSSMVGDRFEIEDRAWLVAGCGFDELAPARFKWPVRADGSNKTFGELSTDEKRAAAKAAALRLEAEFVNPAVAQAISRIMGAAS